MANWTDENIEFTPYRQQQPIEAMAQVGMIREEKFQQGIQTVQGMYDSLLALPLAKTEDKDYVKERVNQLNNSVKQSISGDFSNQRLLNQIGGLASQISNDPTVQTAVQSTAKMQAGFTKAKADQERALKEGKNPINNINDYNDRVNEYMSDGQSGTSFSEDYTPYVDVIDRAIKLFKEQTGGDNISRDAFYIDKDGNTQVSPTLREGIDPKRIQSVLSLVYQQPDVQQQLSIDGRQTYKGIPPPAMAEALTQSADATLKSIEATIRGLQLKMATDGTIDGVATTNQINQLKELAKQTEDEFNENTKILLSDNPDQLKTKLVQQGITSNFINAYSYDKMKKSPLWETTMDSLKYELDLVKNGMDQEKFKYDRMDRDRKYNLDVQKEYRMAMGKKVDADGNPIPDGGDAFSITANVPESSGKFGSTTFNSLYEGAQNDLTQANFGVVHDIYNSKETDTGDFNPIKLDPTTGAYTYNVDPTGVSGYKSAAEASVKYLNTFIEAKGNVSMGTATQDVKNAIQKTVPQMQYVQALTTKKRELDAQKDAVLQKIKGEAGWVNGDFVDSYIVQNKLTGWKASESRLKQGYGEDWEKNFGIKGKEKTSAKGEFQGYELGHREKMYNEFKKKFDATIVPQFQNVEKAYREAQLNLLPVNTVLLGSTPEDKEINRTKYSLVGSSTAKGNKAYKAFRNILEGEDKASPKNIYGGQYDPLEKKYYLSVQRGAEQPEKIEVTRDEFESIPQFKTDNAFWGKFGDLLSITNKTTTDVKTNGQSGGFATSYQMERPADSKYQVGYHVVSAGKDIYNLKLYIKDRRGNDVLNTTAGLTATPSGIMDAISQLENSDVYIDALISQRK